MTLTSLRESLKLEIGIFFPLVVLRSLDGSDYPLNLKLSVLREEKMSFVVAGLYNSSVGLLWRPSLQHLLNSHIVVTSIAATQLHGKSNCKQSSWGDSPDPNARNKEMIGVQLFKGDSAPLKSKKSVKRLARIAAMENDDDEEWLPLDILEALKELRDRKIFDTEDMYTIADAWGWTWEMEIRNSPPRRWSQEWEVELEMAVKLMRKHGSIIQASKDNMAELYVAKASHWWKPTRRDMVALKEAHGEMDFCTKRLTKEAQ
ncbi:hypothetical protein Tco_1325187, partial [Tanacetum coccineum]